MKKILPIVLFISVGYSQKEYNINHIVEVNGVYKKKFSFEIVNGNVYRMYDDIKGPLGKMKNGMKEGEWMIWKDNGTIDKVENYKNGEPDGLWTEWHKSGQKWSEITIKDGKAISETKWSYDYNGQKEIERTYKDGELISKKCWDEDGNEKDCN